MIVPDSVERLTRQLDKKKFWFQVSHNAKATSCRDAATKRFRLGEIGIPLCDELKSTFGVYTKNGHEHLLMIHCRGSHKFDYDKINTLIDSNFIRLPSDVLAEKYSMQYGLVNPFVVLDEPNVKHLFDERVFELGLPPYTMMTNAGSFEWGIEFIPQELHKVITNLNQANLVQEPAHEFANPPVIGIITGNSPDSGILLWQSINSHIRASLGKDFHGDISFPHVFIDSIPVMGLSMELDKREQVIWPIIEAAVQRLCQRGISVLSFACNTTQYFNPRIEEICNLYNVKHVKMVDVVRSYLRKEAITSFDFLGIDHVVDFDRWSAFTELSTEFDLNVPDAKVIERINQLAFEVKKSYISAKGINQLRDIIRDSTSTNTVVIALTEISVILSSQKRNLSGKLFIDTLQLLAIAIAEIYVAFYQENSLLIRNNK